MWLSRKYLHYFRIENFSCYKHSLHIWIPEKENVCPCEYINVHFMRCVSLADWLGCVRIILCTFVTVFNSFYWRYPFFHYSDTIMNTMAFPITNVSVVSLIVCSSTENIKTPRHWPLWGDSAGDKSYETQFKNFMHYVFIIVQISDL